MSGVLSSMTRLDPGLFRLLPRDRFVFSRNAAPHRMKPAALAEVQ